MKRSRIVLIAIAIAPVAAIAQTGGLTRVQLYALQQQLKAECGLDHATGRMDGPTRHAIAVCNKKYGTHGDGAELLSAMNIGFSAGDNSPGMGTLMGNSGSMPASSMSSGSMDMSGNAMGMSNRAAAGTRARRRARGANRDSTLAATSDSVMRADRDAHGHNQGRTKKSDTTFAPLADSMLRADRGGNPPVNPPKPAKKKH